MKKHGHTDVLGNSRSLFSQPYTKVKFAARLGVVSLCYPQQAFGMVLSNLKKDSPKYGRDCTKRTIHFSHVDQIS